jgi:hypothetical protein
MPEVKIGARAEAVASGGLLAVTKARSWALLVFLFMLNAKITKPRKTMMFTNG